MTEKDRDSLLKKIEIAQFGTYEETSLTKYKELVKLEEQHGVSLGEAHAWDDACKDFVNAIDGMKEKLDTAKFIGIMADGPTDAAIMDQDMARQSRQYYFLNIYITFSSNIILSSTCIILSCKYNIIFLTYNTFCTDIILSSSYIILTTHIWYYLSHIWYFLWHIGLWFN